MKYKKGDKFIYQDEGKSKLNGKTVTVICRSASISEVTYHCKIGCCILALILEEKLDTFKIIPIAPS